ncbi:type VII secretion integral membrane protein EccD [Streptomyces sp. NBC_01525]|uniref:type VII secretion integral membrane protein EccD n=1 Tax=Streptomyces sp. NBC_01525 TaxID=2903893 RepID=UPI00386DC595
MTTSLPAASHPATEVCRITIDGPGGRADLAVPMSTPISALLPVLIRHAVAGPDAAGKPWVLQRLGEDPLDADGTPQILGLRHGDLLHLRPADVSLPALHFDDISDGVAHAIGGQPDRWSPELTRRLALAVACVVLTALAAAVLGTGPGLLTSLACGMVALVLSTGCVLASRKRANSGSILLAGFGAFAFAGLAGLTFRQGVGGAYAPGLPGVLVAAGCVGVLAVAMLALRPLPMVLPATFLLTAVAAASGVILAAVTHWHGTQAVAVVAVAMFVLGHFGPRLSLRMARLRIPQLPRDAEELQTGIDPEPERLINRRVSAANAYLNTLNMSSALVYIVACWLLVHDLSWIGWLLPLVFSAAILLRARGMTGTMQRIPMTVAGVLGLALVLVLRTAPAGPVSRGTVLAVLLAAVALLLVAAWRLPTNRLLPLWGHGGDILEMITAMALLPLLLQELHVFAYFRSLAG